MKRTEAAHQECSYCEHKVMFEPGMPTLADWHSIRRIDSVSFSRFIEPGERDQYVSGWFERIKAFARNMAAGKVVAHETGAACCGKWYSATAYDYACNQRDEARAEVERLKLTDGAAAARARDEARREAKEARAEVVRLRKELAEQPFCIHYGDVSKIATLTEERDEARADLKVYAERIRLLARRLEDVRAVVNP